MIHGGRLADWAHLARPGSLEIDYDADVWADVYDKDIQGGMEIDTEENREEFPGGFFWDCCGKHGDEVGGCCTGSHVAAGGGIKRTRFDDGVAPGLGGDSGESEDYDEEDEEEEGEEDGEDGEEGEEDEGDDDESDAQEEEEDEAGEQENGDEQVANAVQQAVDAEEDGDDDEEEEYPEYAQLD